VSNESSHKRNKLTNVVERNVSLFKYLSDRLDDVTPGNQLFKYLSDRLDDVTPGNQLFKYLSDRLDDVTSGNQLFKYLSDRLDDVTPGNQLLVILIHISCHKNNAGQIYLCHSRSG
jgi:hypothetical protein